MFLLAVFWAGVGHHSKKADMIHTRRNLIVKEYLALIMDSETDDARLLPLVNHCGLWPIRQ